MSRKSSTFVRETRERETWLTSFRDPESSVNPEQLLAIAALVRGVSSTLPGSDEAEEKSRALGIEELQKLQRSRGQSTQVRAPRFLEFGRLVRFVFTLGRRR